jgi:hypothetical protein
MVFYKGKEMIGIKEITKHAECLEIAFRNGGRKNIS